MPLKSYPKDNRPTPTRTKQLAQSHIESDRVGYDSRPGKPGRAAYERELHKVIGVTSLKRASRPQRELAIAHFSSKGDNSADWRMPSVKRTAEEEAALARECQDLLDGIQL